MTDQRLAVREATQIVERGFDDATIALIKKTVGDPKNPLTTDELSLFLSVCRYTGLNPLNREIYPLRIQGRLTIWTGIDGHRRIAQASPRFRGMAGPYWCGPDGQWTDVWLGSEAPAACKVGVYLPGRQEPTWGIAYYKNYRSRTSDTWKTQPEQMLAIRAESFALRKCFSRELGAIAMPDDDDTGWGEVGDGALDVPEPDPSPRRQAIAAQMDAALAEADALLAEPIEATPFEQEQAPEETGELPGPRWANTPAGREASAIADALLSLPTNEPARRFVLPANSATDQEVRQWVESKKRLLQARTAQR